jgi:hypothetical protein
MERKKDRKAMYGSLVSQPLRAETEEIHERLQKTHI